MADQIGLFTGAPSTTVLPARKPGPLNRGQLVKLRLEQGRHPHRGDALGPEGETCGSCLHCRRPLRNTKVYLKCAHGPDTRGPATDIRAKWPACTLWKPAKPTSKSSGA